MRNFNCVKNITLLSIVRTIQLVILISNFLAIGRFPNYLVRRKQKLQPEHQAKPSNVDRWVIALFAVMRTSIIPSNTSMIIQLDFWPEIRTKWSFHFYCGFAANNCAVLFSFICNRTSLSVSFWIFSATLYGFFDLLLFEDCFAYGITFCNIHFKYRK